MSNRIRLAAVAVSALATGIIAVAGPAQASQDPPPFPGPVSPCLVAPCPPKAPPPPTFPGPVSPCLVEPCPPKAPPAPSAPTHGPQCLVEPCPGGHPVRLPVHQHFAHHHAH